MNTLINHTDEPKITHSKPFKMDCCNHCKHQNDVEIFSMENVFCSFWVEVVHKKHSCKKFKSFINPNN